MSELSTEGKGLMTQKLKKAVPAQHQLDKGYVTFVTTSTGGTHGRASEKLHPSVAENFILQVCSSFCSALHYLHMSELSTERVS